MNTKIEPTVKPFYIDNTTITPEQREDLYKRCVAAGAYGWDALEEATYKWFGVDEVGDISSWDNEDCFTDDGVPKTTYGQVEEYLVGLPAVTEEVGFTEELLALCTKHAKLTSEGNGAYTNPYLVYAIAGATKGGDFDFLYDWASELSEL